MATEWKNDFVYFQRFFNLLNANRSDNSKLNKLVKKSSKTDANNWALRKVDDLEEATRKGQQREV